MKKFIAFTALAVILSFAAQVFAATNPFMDVPLNHWAYDAIAQLSAHGILSGYPDGTYNGKQPMTRYELASALARSLAVVDMTKASKQDVEMLKKLVVEFKDELEALGVKIAELDERVSLIEERLGGWRLSGVLRLDVTHNSRNKAPSAEGNVNMSRARLRIERWFGDPDNPMHFVSVVQGFRGRRNQTSSDNWRTFYVEIPFFLNSKLLIGRFSWDAESKYYLGGYNISATSKVGSYIRRDAILSDRTVDAIGITKKLSIGSIRGYVSHTSNEGEGGNQTNRAFDRMVDRLGSNASSNASNTDYTEWEIFGAGEFQINEKFGFDVGFSGILGDNAEPAKDNDTYSAQGGYAQYALRFKSLWSVFAGLNFKFTEDAAFKAIYYYQKRAIDYWETDSNGNYAWREPEYWGSSNNNSKYDDKAKHWAVMLDVGQKIFKFTSLWVEYGQYDEGFVSLSATAVDLRRTHFVPADMKYWRIALAQKWNKKWATHVFYNGYKYDYDSNAQGRKPKEWGLGVQYTLNPNVIIALNYLKIDYDDTRSGDDNKVRFRTQVTF